MHDQLPGLLQEDVLTLNEAARVLPNRPSLSTLFRWADKGVRGVRLETIKIGGRVYTTREAIDRFLDRLNKPEATEPKRFRGKSERNLAAEAAGEILEREGFDK